MSKRYVLFVIMARFVIIYSVLVMVLAFFDDLVSRVQLKLFEIAFSFVSRKSRCFLLSLMFCQGEAFVPENIVRIGRREGGRRGVQTLEVHDERIK